MLIQEAILHIFDFESGMHVLSQQALDLSDEAVSTFVSKQVEAIHLDAQHQQATLATSSFTAILSAYPQTDFVTTSQAFANRFSSEFQHCELTGKHDLLVVRYDEQGQRFAIIVLARKSAYTHHVWQDEQGARTEIIRHESILPSSSQKATTYMSVELATLQAFYRDRKRVYDGERQFILPTFIAPCEASEVSPQHALRAVNKIVSTLAQAHDLQPSCALAQVKAELVQAGNEAQPLRPQQLAKQLFAEQPLVQAEFVSKLAEQAIPEAIPFAPEVATKTGKMHTLKTDAGIEVKVPSAYMSDPEYVTIETQADGTLMIQLKNIGTITDK